MEYSASAKEAAPPHVRTCVERLEPQAAVESCRKVPASSSLSQVPKADAHDSHLVQPPTLLHPGRHVRCDTGRAVRSSTSESVKWPKPPLDYAPARVAWQLAFAHTA